MDRARCNCGEFRNCKTLDARQVCAETSKLDFQKCFCSCHWYPGEEVKIRGMFGEGDEEDEKDYSGELRNKLVDLLHALAQPATNIPAGIIKAAIAFKQYEVALDEYVEYKIRTILSERGL